MKNKKTIYKDIEKWSVQHRLTHFKSTLMKLTWLCLFYQEFRNVLYCRIRVYHAIIPRLLQIFYYPLKSLYISTLNIGDELFIQHGFCTLIGAKSIGHGCWINQQVSIGFAKSEDDSPVIGNHVRVGAGAIILGNVHIGDHSIIGAGSVVVKDVPPNCTVVGNPAYIIKKDGVKTQLKL